MHLTSTTGARSCERTTTQYDLILFALPDSLTLVSGTARCGWRATCSRRRRSRPRPRPPGPDGAFAMYNYYRKSWLVDRFAGTLDRGLRPRALRDTFRRNAARAGGRADPRRPVAATRPGSQRRRCPAAGDRRPPLPLPAAPEHPHATTWARCGAILLVTLLVACALAGPLRSMRSATPTCSCWARRSCCSKRRT